MADLTSAKQSTKVSHYQVSDTSEVKLECWVGEGQAGGCAVSLDGAPLAHSAMIKGLSLGFGKALKSFSAAFPKGGTAMNFAEHLSGRMAENLRDVSGKVMKMSPEFGGTFARLSENMATKFSSPEFTEKFAGIVSKATGTEPGAILSAEQISHAGDSIISQVQNLTGTYAVSLGAKGDLDASRFEEKAKAPVAL